MALVREVYRALSGKVYVRFMDKQEYEFENEAHYLAWRDQVDPEVARRTAARAIDRG